MGDNISLVENDILSLVNDAQLKARNNAFFHLIIVTHLM